MPHLEGLGPQSDSLLQEMGQSLVWLQFPPISTKKGSNQILSLPPTIAISSVPGSGPGSGLGPFGTTGPGLLPLCLLLLVLLETTPSTPMISEPSTMLSAVEV